MSNKNPRISYCFGAYNEEAIIENTVKTLIKELDKLFGKNRYEILVVENGSSDNTLAILKKIKNKSLRVLTIQEKSHGVALRTAIEKAKYDRIVITGADLPFGFTDIKQALKYWEEYDLVFGSKLHPKSTYQSPGIRKFVSRIYGFLLQIFFQLNIKDPQGSVFIKREKISPFLKYCDSKTGFLTTQIAIYSQKYHLSMKEIAVGRNPKNVQRPSKYNIFSDGSKMFKAIVSEYIRLQKLKLNPART